LSALRVKRLNSDFSAPNKVCPNMFVTRESLSIDATRRNLFSARELAQVKILYDKNNTARHLLSDNTWIKNFLPNIKIYSTKNIEGRRRKFLSLIDRFFFILQFAYMSGRITKEEIRPNVARFHPGDVMGGILALYEVRIRENLIVLKQEKPPKITSAVTPGY